ncbi:MAG: serine--tRNA ligase, partial [Clostridiales bacterium]
MLDLKFVRTNPELVVAALAKRGGKISLDVFLSLEEERRSILGRVEDMKSRRNTVSKEIGIMKKSGENASAIMTEMRELGDAITVLDERLKQVEEKLTDCLMDIPNIPHQSVPIGMDDSDNEEQRRWGTPAEMDFQPLNHWDIGVNLGILDFERAGKISGARFTVYKGAGARLERATINFFLDQHTENHGYQEIFPPFMVNSNSMRGTGQLPKFKEDMFHIEGTDYYLVPTAEVPVTNLHAGEILEEADLPICYAAYTACFRAEAGAAGRDTRGLIRQHQFNKVELVKFTRPEDSYVELEKLTG